MSVSNYTMPLVRQYGEFIRGIQSLMSQTLAKYDIVIEEGANDEHIVYKTINNRRLMLPDVPVGMELLHAGVEPYCWGEYDSYDTYLKALEVALEQMEYNIALEAEHG